MTLEQKIKAITKSTHATSCKKNLCQCGVDRIEWELKNLFQSESKAYLMELIGEPEKGEQVQASCPDLMSGCAVYHTEFRMTPKVKTRNEFRAELLSNLSGDRKG